MKEIFFKLFCQQYVNKFKDVSFAFIQQNTCIIKFAIKKTNTNANYYRIKKYSYTNQKRYS